MSRGRRRSQETRQEGRNRRAAEGGVGKGWLVVAGPAPAGTNSPLAAGPARLRPLFATLATGLRSPVDAGICPGQVTLQILGLGKRRSCRHGSGEGRETGRRWGQNASTRKGRQPRDGAGPRPEVAESAKNRAAGRCGHRGRARRLARDVHTFGALHSPGTTPPGFFSSFTQPPTHPPNRSKRCSVRPQPDPKDPAPSGRLNSRAPARKWRATGCSVAEFEYWFHSWLAVRPRASYHKTGRIPAPNSERSQAEMILLCEVRRAVLGTWSSELCSLFL